MKKKKSKIKHKPFLIFAICIILVAAILSFKFYKSKSLGTTNPISSGTQKVVYPTQYSDTHITANAIKSDPRFKDLSFSDREELLSNVSSSVKTISPTPSNEIEAGTWLWTPMSLITPKYRDFIIAGAKENNIRNIYLSIDSYLDIFTLPDGPDKDKKKLAFDTTLEDFITTAHKNNITVDAEAGWRNWAEKGNTYKAFAVLDYATQFNQTHTEKLRGFQYDIEPYLLDAYTKDKKTTLGDFVSLIDQTVTGLDKSDLLFSVVIPEFYDGTDGETPEFNYAGKSGFTLDHLVDILDRRPGSKLIVMSYRNFSKGENSSIDISKDEISRADKSNTKVIIAQETADVEPSYVTFHNTSRSYYQSQIQNIRNTFSKDKSYGGLAIHYINALMNL